MRVLLPGPAVVAPASGQPRAATRPWHTSHEQKLTALISGQQQQQHSCRGAQRQRQRQLVPHATPAYNPQNVDNPQVLPAPEYTAEQAASIQLEALQNNDQPWGNHGVQTAYEWAFDVGGLDPSMYFGFPKDLYHFDHFMGMFTNKLPELVNLRKFDIRSVVELPASSDAPATWVVRVDVEGPVAQQQAALEFHLRRKMVGAKKGSLMTYMLRRV